MGTPTIIAVSLIVFGVLLGIADRTRGRREVVGFTVRDAVIVGAAQALALNPGTSRSGITMTAARGVGFSRDAAARLSFLMMVPVTGGAVLFKLGDLFGGNVDSLPLLIGVVTSGISGWFAVWGLLRLVRTRSFDGFVGYRVLAGIAVLAIVASSWR